jgi:hypothetical protein
MIECRICSQQFAKIIPWQHLRKLHNLSGKEYIEKYGGSLYSSETLEKFSSRVPHNKGKKLAGPKLDNLRVAIKIREEKYISGELSRPKQTMSTERRKNISTGVIKNIEIKKSEDPDFYKNVSKKAKITWYKNGNIGPMSGKKHSDETREKLRRIQKSKVETNKKIRLEKYKEIIENNGFELLELNDNFHQAKLKCKTCANSFFRTVQYFHPSKIKSVGKLCQTCHPPLYTSQAENDLIAKIEPLLNQTAQRNTRQHIYPYELDAYFANIKLAVEYNGLYWHGELNSGKDQYYHRSKYTKCRDLGIKLITIFEDEWLHTPEIVLDKFNTNKTKIFARHCNCQKIDNKLAKEFLNKNHLMGYNKTMHSWGLYYKDELVMVMTSSNNHKSRKQVHYEIDRLATKLGYQILGGASKLFKNGLLADINPDTVISYSDLRYGEGNVFSKMGFKRVDDSPACYWYIDTINIKRIHRFKLRKTHNDDQNLTEWENRINQGYDRVWDCGNSKWIWSK